MKLFYRRWKEKKPGDPIQYRLIKEDPKMKRWNMHQILWKGLQLIALLMVYVPAFAQSMALQGQGGQQLSAYAHLIVGFVFWAVLIGIIIMGSVVAYKLTHDQRGWEHLKMWVFALCFFGAIDGIVGYFLFAAQNTGLNNQGTLF
jgi:cytochrome c oxidase assembly factor CtaG